MMDKFRDYQKRASMYYVYHTIQRYMVSDILLSEMLLLPCFWDAYHITFVYKHFFLSLSLSIYLSIYLSLSLIFLLFLMRKYSTFFFFCSCNVHLPFYALPGSVIRQQTRVGNFVLLKCLLGKGGTLLEASFPLIFLVVLQNLFHHCLILKLDFWQFSQKWFGG